MDTIVAFLQKHAESNPLGKAFIFIDDGGNRSSINFSILHQKARAVALGLLSRVDKGDCVVLLLPQGLEYITAFLGCLYAGVVAVPLYPPTNPKQSERVRLVVENCEAKLALSDAVGLPLHHSELISVTILSVDEVQQRSSKGPLPSAKGDQLAFLQYTSGSTGTPKGVMVNHDNIIANLQSLQSATRCNANDVFCNWLPLFHDLGLVNTLLLPLYLGCVSVLMSPAKFFKRPIAWFGAITQYKATICGAPNFAFEHCIERIKENQLADLDLTSWRIAFNAAEPITADTLSRFYEFFSPVGFRKEAFYPSYGMAEATVFISGGNPFIAPICPVYDLESLQRGKAVDARLAERSQVLVACGNAQKGHHLKIVDPEHQVELTEGSVGEVWFSGPSVAQGYWKNESETRACFDAALKHDGRRYLRTGDLGFILDGQLYISGRIKDVLIIKGRNFYPQDIERVACGSYPGLCKGKGVAFESEGKALLVQEVSRKAAQGFDCHLAAVAVRQEVFSAMDLIVDEVVFIRQGSLTKTSSGKLQRAFTKQQFVDRKLDVIQNRWPALEKNGEFDLAAEAMLAEIWTDVFGIETIGIEDDFFSVGGHSLLAVKLLSRIRSILGVDLSIEDLFHNPSIRSLAREIGHRGRCLQPEISVCTRGESPASHEQQTFWLLELIESTHHYNLFAAFELKGEVNISALEQACIAIIERHHILRTVYVKSSQGGVVPITKGEFGFHLSELGYDSTFGSNELTELVAREVRRPFDLSSDLMLRVALGSMGNGRKLLVVTLPHIAADGWSKDLLISELNVFYRLFSCNGGKRPLKPEIQYSDYAKWKNERVEGLLEKQRSFWSAKLAGLPPRHNLPLDKVRPVKRTYAGACHYQTINEDTLLKLNNLARENRTTLFTVISSAFSVLLARYSGESDIVFGYPVSGRDRTELQGLIGCFVNVLLMRADFRDDPTFERLLSRNNKYILEAHQNKDLPLSTLVDELRPAQSSSYNSLFQVMLVMHGSQKVELTLPQIDVTPLQVDVGTAKLDLTLSVQETCEGLALEWEYATALFEPDTIARMAIGFEVLIDAASRQPTIPVSQLPVMAEEDRHRQLVEWNNTRADFGSGVCVHELIERQVVLNPGAVAVIFGETHAEPSALTYGELNRRANCLARYLVEKRSIKPDGLVGLCVERSLDMVVAMLGILKAGAAYVPLDPEYPKARLEYMLQDAKLETVITQSRLRDKVPLDSDQAVCIGDIYSGEWLTEQHDYGGISLRRKVDPASLAYVIYTSGSTGRAKGVMVEHRNVTNFLLSMANAPGMTSSDCLLAVTSTAFDIHALEVFLPLITGAKLVVASQTAVGDPKTLTALMAHHRVTQMQATPATWKLLVDSQWRQHTPLKVICGGEALSRSLANALLNQSTIELWNMYGPTETTVWSTLQKIAASDAGVAIGRPIHNTQVYVVNEKLAIVPQGVVGELLIGGLGVARGYLNRSDLTEQKFIQSPFARTDKWSGGRLYRTGDLVRWLPGGRLEYLGRNDNQLKIRGHRVELGEIEQTLLRHEAIKDVVVVGVGSGPDVERLIAYVVIDGVLQYDSVLTDNTVMSGVFRQALASQLPSYMIPSDFVYLATLPLTPNGKIDRKALFDHKVTPRGEYEPPQTETEILLCDTIQEVLGLERVGQNDEFFLLGGNSLTAARIAAKISEKCRVDISPRIFLSGHDLTHMADAIDEAIALAINNQLGCDTKDKVRVEW